MAGFLEGGGRIFSKKNTWKGVPIAKGGKGTHNFRGMLSFDCRNLLNKNNILVKPQNAWNIPEYSNFITSPYPYFCHTFLSQTFITSSQCLGCISVSANVDFQPFKQKNQGNSCFFFAPHMFFGLHHVKPSGQIDMHLNIINQMHTFIQYIYL